MSTAKKMKLERDIEVDPNSRFWHRGWKWNSAKKLRQWLKRGKSENEDNTRLTKRSKKTINPTFRVNLTAEGSQKYKRRKKKKRHLKNSSDRT